MSPDRTSRAAWRLRVYPWVILITLLLALVVAAATFDVADPDSRLGGDYPAFYSAGAIAAAGDWDELYEPARQQAEQAGLIDDDGGYLYFSYPPFVAALYAPLALIGYQWSFVLHTLLMAAAVAGAVWVCWPWLERLRLPRQAMIVAALGFYPLLTAVTGGQNTSLSLLLLAAAARLDRDNRAFLAGLVAAGLLFKPQFGVIVLPLLLLTRRWRAVAGLGSGAIGLYLGSAAFVGGSWLSGWWAQAADFRDLNTAANGTNFISIPGFLENALGSGSAVATVVGYGLAAVVAAGVAFVWWRHQKSGALVRWALVGAAAVTVAPQTLYYDAGLLLLPGVAILAGSTRWRWVGIAFVLSWTQVAADGLGWSPLGPLSVAAVGFLVLHWARAAPRADRMATS